MDSFANILSLSALIGAAAIAYFVFKQKKQEQATTFTQEFFDKHKEQLSNLPKPARKSTDRWVKDPKTGALYGGRGRAPTWYWELKNSGANMYDFKITKQETH